MRKTIKIPRILKITEVKDHSISVIFNNGEQRIIDMEKLLKKLGLSSNSSASILSNTTELSKAEINNNTLSWSNVEQYITGKDGHKIKVPFEIGADVLLKNSMPEKSKNLERIGKIIRAARLKSGLSQQELAIVSGTSRSYISRIENNHSDIELATLRKIIETGLGKKLEISIKE